MGVTFSLFSGEWSEGNYASFFFFALPLLVYATAFLASTGDTCVRSAHRRGLQGRNQYPDHVNVVMAIGKRKEWRNRVSSLSRAIADFSFNEKIKL